MLAHLTLQHITLWSPFENARNLPRGNGYWYMRDIRWGKVPFRLPHLGTKERISDIGLSSDATQHWFRNAKHCPMLFKRTLSNTALGYLKIKLTTVHKLLTALLAKPKGDCISSISILNRPTPVSFLPRLASSFRRIIFFSIFPFEESQR
jgi:hypothetical protein